MKLEDMTKAELELLSNCDLTSLLLKENKRPMNTLDIFKKICSLLGYTEEEYTDKIGEFYTSLTTDKRFILLDSAEWDLRDNHAIKISIDDDDEEEIETEEFEEEETEEFEEPEEIDDIEEPLEDEDLDIDDEEDIDDLAIVDEEEIES
jgi:DNA-directed RNA polymerase subunit delta